MRKQAKNKNEINKQDEYRKVDPLYNKRFVLVLQDDQFKWVLLEAMTKCTSHFFILTSTECLIWKNKKFHTGYLNAFHLKSD